MKRVIGCFLILTLMAGGCKSAQQEELQKGSAQKTQEEPLTQEELTVFEEILLQGENYGFLLSDYLVPQDIDLNEVFYNGAGIGKEQTSGQEREAYMKAEGIDEIDTDFFCVSAGDMNAFLLEKTGLPLGEMNRPLTWVYLPEYDSYYAQHGDSNIRGFLCESGVRKGEIYQILCLADTYTRFDYECLVTLKKTEKGVQFISNQVLWDELGSVKPGAEDISLEGMGHVVRAWQKENERATGDFSSPIFDSATRYYTEQELEGIGSGKMLLSVYRNEIYARHGYIFASEFWSQFFQSYTWYEGIVPAEQFDTGSLNAFEKANLELAVKAAQG